MARKVKLPPTGKPIDRKLFRTSRTESPRAKGKPAKGQPRVIPPPRRGGVWE